MEMQNAISEEMVENPFWKSIAQEILKVKQTILNIFSNIESKS